MSTGKQKICFVISPIGDAESPTRKRSDMLLEHVFKPAMEPLDFQVIRADKISEPGSITIQVIERILQAELVIADLTDHNPNVFYELAVRHAANRGVIHIICSGQPIPFDVADLRTITVTLDIPGAAKAISDIVAQAKQIESGELGQTPIRLANVLQHFESRTSDDNLIMREMLDRMTELGSSMRDLAEHQKSTTRQFENYLGAQQRFETMRRADIESFYGESRSSLLLSSLEDAARMLGPNHYKRYLAMSQRNRDALLKSFDRMRSARPELSIREVVQLVMSALEDESKADK